MEAVTMATIFVSNLSPWDVFMALLGLFLASAASHKLTSDGPMLWPVVGISPTLFRNIDAAHEWITGALRRCGGSFPYRGVWMGGARGTVTADPAAVERVLGAGGIANFPKGPYFRDRFADFLGGGIFNADGEAWRAQRRAAAAEMHSPRFLERSAEAVRELVHGKLLGLVDKLCRSGEVVDLQDVLLRFTFDNICWLAFGINSGCLAADHLPEVPFARAFERATELTLFRFLVPPFVWKSMRALNLGKEKELRSAIRAVHEFADNAVRDRRNELQKLGHLDVIIDRPDLLSRLVGAREEVGEKGGAAAPVAKLKFSDTFIRDFCISFILAGRDTSSVALAWFFWLLHDHPSVETRILAELHDIIHRREKGCDVTATDVVFTLDELKQMDYLHAALSESLRLYPPVPFGFKEAAGDDTLPGGARVRKGAKVIYSIYSMARLEAVWGEDCREFKPERWVGVDGKFTGESMFKFAVFNAGPRLCVGKRFAYMQMKMVAAAVLLRYRVSVGEGQEVAPRIATTLYMKNGLMVRFFPRQMMD